MAPLEDIRREELKEIIAALKPFAKQQGTPEEQEAFRVVDKWEYAFLVWGWK